MNSHFWKSKILVAVVIGLFSLMVFAETIPSTESLYSRLMAQGKEFYENGDLDKAAAKYQSAQAVAANKEEMAGAYFLLALTYYALVDMDNCQSSLENYFSVSVPSANPLLGKNLPPRFVNLFKSQKREYLQKMAGTADPSAQVKKAEPQPQPTVREHEITVPQVKKKKRFPWLLVVAVTLVAGAAVYYFVVLNKKYTLAANVGTGVNGTPTTGSVKYKKGSVANYNYSAASGYTNLVVTLDGTPVTARGTVTMDKNHTLSAAAVQQHTLTVITYYFSGSGYPTAGTYYFEKGSLVNYWYLSNSHEVQVKLDGVTICNHGSISGYYDVPCSGSFVMNGDRTLEAVSY